MVPRCERAASHTRPGRCLCLPDGVQSRVCVPLAHGSGPQEQAAALACVLDASTPGTRRRPRVCPLTRATCACCGPAGWSLPLPLEALEHRLRLPETARAWCEHPPRECWGPFTTRAVCAVQRRAPRTTARVRGAHAAPAADLMMRSMLCFSCSHRCAIERDWGEWRALTSKEGCGGLRWAFQEICEPLHTFTNVLPLASITVTMQSGRHPEAPPRSQGPARSRPCSWVHPGYELCSDTDR